MDANHSGNLVWSSKFEYIHIFLWSSLVAQAGKEYSCSVGDLGWEDPLEKGKATRSVFWPGGDCIVHGVTQSRTRLSDFGFHRGRGFSPEQNRRRFSVLFETMRRRLLVWLAVASCSVCCHLVLWLPPTTVFGPEGGTCPLPYAAEQRTDAPGCSRITRESAENNLWELPRRIGILLPLTRLFPLPYFQSTSSRWTTPTRSISDTTTFL